MEEDCLSWQIMFTFTSWGQPGVYEFLTWGVMSTGCTRKRKGSQQRQGDPLSNAMFCWKSPGPGINMDRILTDTTYHDIAAGQVHSLMARVLYNSCGLLASCHTAKNIQEFEEHEKASLDTKYPRSQSDRYLLECGGQTSLIDEGPTSQHTGLKWSAANFWYQMPQHIFIGLMLSLQWWVIFWVSSVNLHNFSRWFSFYSCA